MAFKLPFGKGKRAEGEGAAEEQAEKLAQDIMPLKTIQGSIIRRTDGKSVTMVYMEGTNDSLFTLGQKLDEARLLAHCLVAINHPATILKLPKAIDSGNNLVFIDQQIEALQRELAAEHALDDPGDPRVIRLRFLKEVVRPEAEDESLLGDREVHPTYICMEFDDYDDESIMRDTGILVEQIQSTGRHAHTCKHAEIIEALQLYFTPHSVRESFENGRSPVMPSVDMGGRR